MVLEQCNNTIQKDSDHFLTKLTIYFFHHQLQHNTVHSNYGTTNILSALYTYNAFSIRIFVQIITDIVSILQ